MTQLFLVPIEVTANGVMVVFAVIVALAAAAGVVKYQFRKSKSVADSESIQTYKTLAESRKATILELEQKDVKSQETIKRLTEAHDDCERVRNDLSQLSLRLVAKNASYERCINRLEIRIGITPTNFDDPAQHITAT